MSKMYFLTIAQSETVRGVYGEGFYELCPIPYLNGFILPADILSVPAFASLASFFETVPIIDCEVENEID